MLVHVGFAMSRIDAAEAAETLKILTELGEMQAELENIRDSIPRCRGGIGAFDMSSENELKGLYPFLHGKRQDAAALDTALLHSVEEKARESRDDERAILRRAGGTSWSPRPRRSPASIAAAAGCFPWATAARAATRPMSPSNSCIRSPPAGRRWPRSTSSPISR